MSTGVSLVIADTESYILANNAIDQCLRKFEFDEVIVFTDKPEYWQQHRTVRIEKIQNINAYNDLMISTVPFYVQTDFFIVAQFDGFILDGAAFLNDFYDYDYIGAPWPQAAYSHFRVGNGGFSWRSKRLAVAAAGMASFRDSMDSEDAFIGRVIRVALETRHQCRFPDAEFAARFSYEMLLPDGPVFGFHGLMHLPIIYQNNLAYLFQNLPIRSIQNKLNVLSTRFDELDPENQRIFREQYNIRLISNQ
jgi:hypothetical protein